MKHYKDNDCDKHNQSCEELQKIYTNDKDISKVDTKLVKIQQVKATKDNSESSKMVKVETLHTISSLSQIKQDPHAPNMTHIGRNVRCALKRAVYEKRVVVGVASAVKQLLNRSTSTDSDSTDSSSSLADSRSSDDVVFCVLAPPAAGDSATHMQTILLEAFCYENDIYIIKVDSAAKLSKILGARTTQTCALIQRPWADDESVDSSGSESTWDESQLTAAEAAMVDHCEEFWDVPQQPLVQLPD